MANSPSVMNFVDVTTEPVPPRALVIGYSVIPGPRRKYTVFHVKVAIANLEWTLQRSLRDFLALKEALDRICAELEIQQQHRENGLSHYFGCGLLARAGQSLQKAGRTTLRRVQSLNRSCYNANGRYEKVSSRRTTPANPNVASATAFLRPPGGLVAGSAVLKSPPLLASTRLGVFLRTHNATAQIIVRIQWLEINRFLKILFAPTHRHLIAQLCVGKFFEWGPAFARPDPIAEEPPPISEPILHDKSESQGTVKNMYDLEFYLLYSIIRNKIPRMLIVRLIFVVLFVSVYFFFFSDLLSEINQIQDFNYRFNSYRKLAIMITENIRFVSLRHKEIVVLL